MSHDEPNQPKPSKHQPSVTQPSAAERVSLQVRAALRSTSIKVLRSTIQALESTVKKLESLPPDAASAPLLSPELQNRLRSLWQRLVVSWNGLLRQLRTRLPEDFNQRFNDRALTGIIVGSTIALFLVTSNLVAAKPVEVASSRAIAKTSTQVPSVVVPSPTSFPAELTAPAPAISALPTSPTEEVAVPPSPDPSPSPDPLLSPDSSDPLPLPDSSPSPEPSPELLAEEPPFVEPPAPVVELTPEQKLIASIQEQVVGVTDSYTADLIQAVQPNLSRHRLVVKTSKDWYTLSSAQQNQLADDLLSRSQELDFSQLEITDAAGTLLARNPVIGSSMVIVKRRQHAQEVAWFVLRVRLSDSVDRLM